MNDKIVRGLSFSTEECELLITLLEDEVDNCLSARDSEMVESLLRRIRAI